MFNSKSGSFSTMVDFRDVRKANTFAVRGSAKAESILTHVAYALLGLAIALPLAVALAVL